MANIFADIGAGLSGLAGGLQAGIQLDYQDQAMRLQKRAADLEALNGFANIMQLEDPVLREFAAKSFMPHFGFEEDSPESKELVGLIKKADADSRSAFSSMISELGSDYSPALLGEMWKRDKTSVIKFIMEHQADKAKEAKQIKLFQELDPGDGSWEDYLKAAQRAAAVGATDIAQEFRETAKLKAKEAGVGRLSAALKPPRLITQQYTDYDSGKQMVAIIDKDSGERKDVILGDAKADEREFETKDVINEEGHSIRYYIDPDTQETVKSVDFGPVQTPKGEMEALIESLGKLRESKEGKSSEKPSEKKAPTWPTTRGQPTAPAAKGASERGRGIEIPKSQPIAPAAKGGEEAEGSYSDFLMQYFEELMGEE